MTQTGKKKFDSQKKYSCRLLSLFSMVEIVYLKRQVCGSNDMSYDNLCELEKANCTSGQTAIKLQMYGFCGKPNSVVDCKLNES